MKVYVIKESDNIFGQDIFSNILGIYESRKDAKEEVNKRKSKKIYENSSYIIESHELNLKENK